MIKQLEWQDDSYVNGLDDIERIRIYAESPTHSYLISDELNDKYSVLKTRFRDKHTDYCTGFTSVESAQEFSQDDFEKKTAVWLEPDYFALFTQWANDRQIIQNGNILAQGLKLVSEIGELADNLAKGRCTKDDIGDCMVVLNNLVHMQGYTLDECLAQAWNDIKDRKGHMNEHGVFIKQGDEPYTETWTDGHDDADEVGAEWRRLMEKD